MLKTPRAWWRSWTTKTTPEPVPPILPPEEVEVVSEYVSEYEQDCISEAARAPWAEEVVHATASEWRPLSREPRLDDILPADIGDDTPIFRELYAEWVRGVFRSDFRPDEPEEAGADLDEEESNSHRPRDLDDTKPLALTGVRA